MMYACVGRHYGREGYVLTLASALSANGRRFRVRCIAPSGPGGRICGCVWEVNGFALTSGNTSSYGCMRLVWVRRAANGRILARAA